MTQRRVAINTAMPYEGEMTAEAEIRTVIERFVARRFAKDLRLAEDFEPHAIIYGSEAGDIYVGHDEIVRHLEEAMGKPHTVRHAWERLDVGSNGDTGWFSASGPAMVGRDGVETPLPVRVSGVFVRRDGDWRWMLLHVSEPA